MEAIVKRLMENHRLDESKISKQEAISIFSSEENASREFSRYFSAYYNGRSKTMTGAEVADWLKSLRGVKEFNYSDLDNKVVLEFNTKGHGDGYDMPKTYKVKYTVESLD